MSPHAGERFLPERPFPPYAFLPGRDPHPTADARGHSFRSEPEPPATYLPPKPSLDLIVGMQKTEIGKELLELNEKSPLQIMKESFENDKVRALMLYATCMWGLDPNETGVGLFVPLLLTRAMDKAYLLGGSHKMAGAFSREIVRNGGMILEASQVNKINIKGEMGTNSLNSIKSPPTSMI